jgi:hypothetical protein
MKFFASKYNNTDSTVLCIFITNAISTNRAEALEQLRAEFGPWLFLGIRGYSKTDFLAEFGEHLPNSVKQQLELETAIFTYKSEINIKRFDVEKELS